MKKGCAILETFSSDGPSEFLVVSSTRQISPESPKKLQDEQEVMSEASCNATRGKEEDGWRLEPEGKRRRQKSKF